MRTYRPDECAVFCKTKEKYGGLSNMASGFNIRFPHITVSSSEALYQALKFDDPDIQMGVLAAKSPMAAKIVATNYIDQVRPDFHDNRVDVMAWCVAAKLIANPTSFLACLLDTEQLPIIELSVKDDFWGAMPLGNYLVGQNLLGITLTELRDLVDGKQKVDWQLEVKRKFSDKHTLLDTEITLSDIIPSKLSSLF